MSRPLTPSACVIAALIVACSDDGGRDGASDSTQDADVPTDTADVPPDTTDVPDATPGACPAADLGAALGRDRLLLGGSMDETVFGEAPFDIRYQYMAGDVPDEGPCDSCATDCFVRGASCANDAGCAWWGCWQWDALPPGQFVTDFVTETAGGGAVPMITYYIWFSVAGDVEGAAEVEALQDGDDVFALLADFRFLCEVLARDPSIPVILHVEPDLWGYVHQVADDPSTVPVALSAAGDPTCGDLGDSAAGLARCLLAVARDAAPNVLVGFHASAWGAGHDALSVSDPGVDLEAHAAETAAFMLALGAGEADLIVVETSDRDAGYDGRWWDETNATMPHFHQAIAWVRDLGEGMDLAPLWWQVPYGNTSLDDTCDRYRDNRVDYFFDHPDEFAAGGALGIAFGAGATCMTTASTDDGHFLARSLDYYASDRPLLCGE